MGEAAGSTAGTVGAGRTGPVGEAAGSAAGIEGAAGVAGASLLDVALLDRHHGGGGSDPVAGITAGAAGVGSTAVTEPVATGVVGPTGVGGTAGPTGVVGGTAATAGRPLAPPLR